MNSISSLSIGSAGQSGDTSLASHATSDRVLAPWQFAVRCAGQPGRFAHYTIASQGEVNLLLEGYNRICASRHQRDDNLAWASIRRSLMLRASHQNDSVWHQFWHRRALRSPPPESWAYRCQRDRPLHPVVSGHWQTGRLRWSWA